MTVAGAAGRPREPREAPPPPRHRGQRSAAGAGTRRGPTRAVGAPRRRRHGGSPGAARGSGGRGGRRSGCAGGATGQRSRGQTPLRCPTVRPWRCAPRPARPAGGSGGGAAGRGADGRARGAARGAEPPPRSAPLPSAGMRACLAHAHCARGGRAHSAAPRLRAAPPVSGARALRARGGVGGCGLPGGTLRVGALRGCGRGTRSPEPVGERGRGAAPGQRGGSGVRSCGRELAQGINCCGACGSILPSSEPRLLIILKAEACV